MHPKPGFPEDLQAFTAQIDADRLVEQALVYKEAIVVAAIVLLFVLRAMWLS